jgi:hypothetical protein
MLMTKQRRPAIRTLRGWALAVLQEAGAVHECEEHGWAQDRADPTPANAPSTSPIKNRRTASPRTRPSRKVRDVFASIGDTCPECAPANSAA